LRHDALEVSINRRIEVGEQSFPVAPAYADNWHRAAGSFSLRRAIARTTVNLVAVRLGDDPAAAVAQALDGPAIVGRQHIRRGEPDEKGGAERVALPGSRATSTSRAPRDRSTRCAVVDSLTASRIWEKGRETERVSKTWTTRVAWQRLLAVSSAAANRRIEDKDGTTFCLYTKPSARVVHRLHLHHETAAGPVPPCLDDSKAARPNALASFVR
jgi:hypothetical protein